MARPTKLTEQMIKDGWDYLNELDVSIDTLLPTVEGLAIKLGISRDTVYEWDKEYPEFSDIVKKLKNDQAQKLIQNALANKYNASIAKLILSGKHGYVEQSELKATVETVTPILGAKSKDNSSGDISEDTKG
jgi:hypothetical protein